MVDRDFDPAIYAICLCYIYKTYVIFQYVETQNWQNYSKRTNDILKSNVNVFHVLNERIACIE